MIQSVNSNTSLTLDKPFAETTATNSNYRILLNTAAHFPSDTAAKVERALEQLSDINEAAINNNRTVTAATYLNGKGLSNTTGDLNVYPNSVNANTGGKINFHYNQSSSATSSIYENQSGRIRLDCDLWMDNYVYSNINLSGGGQIRFSNIDASTNSSERRVFCFSDKGATALGGLIFLFTSGNAEHSARLRVHNNGVYNDLGIAKKSDGSVYTFAPTPATTDNSTQIATTAFVNNRLPYTNGTFTPIFKGDSTAGAFTYTAQTGKYWKIGRLVYIYIDIAGKCTTQPIGTYCGINGLPFNAAYAPNCGVSTSDFCGGGTSDCFHRICWGYIAQSNNFGGPVLLPKVIHNTNNTFDYAKITANDVSGYNLSIAVNESFHMRFTGIYLASS